MGETSANAATYIAAPMTQPSEPSTEAGKALLAEDYGTTDPRANEPWFEKTRSEYAKRILAIEAEARAQANVTATTGAATVKVFDPKAQAEANATIAALREALAETLAALDSVPTTDRLSTDARRHARALLTQAGRKEPDRE